MRAMAFGWNVVKHVKSNAIVYADCERTLGVGAGQMSRVDSSKIAVWKAGEAGLDLKGSVVASDAFFPFADGLIAAADAGAIAAIQPGDSVRDDEVIAAADERDMVMVFTGSATLNTNRIDLFHERGRAAMSGLFYICCVSSQVRARSGTQTVTQPLLSGSYWRW